MLTVPHPHISCTALIPQQRKVVKEAEEPSADFNSDDEAADDEDVIEQFAMEDFEFDSD